MTEEMVKEGYETFSDSEFCDDAELDCRNEKRKKKFRLNRNTFGIVMMAFVMIFSVANLVLGIINYKRYDEIQAGAQFYFQNGAVGPQENQLAVIGNNETELFVMTYETTTVMHIEIQTAPYKVQDAVKETTTVHAVEAETTAPMATTTSQNLSGVVNINTATVEELTALEGIGEKKARAIVDYRNENGYFLYVEELTNVSGIGEKTLEKNIDKITVG